MSTQIKKEILYLSRFKNGDPRAFTFFFDTYWAELYILAYRHVQDEAISKDIVQEVFIQIWEKRHLLKEDYESLKPYFFKAIKNKILNHYATEKVRENHMEKMLYRMDKFTFLNDHTTAQYQGLENIVDLAVSRLPKTMQEVYLLRNDNYSIQQIAQKLNIAEQTVKNHLSEAKKILKQDLTKRFADHDDIFLVLASAYLFHHFLT
ncbi:sigma-70 family RNA polymerase sigma factor [Sphingobacterium sp. PCS056]|uniref:RNA polymerase sigma factor n=1 Tax=Sphingobacterium TaxID=28453 RepID=UPI00200E51A1|nr:sigma-70 family RNA polymerase sigma factor [Sphingobacterium sp. PCS056]UPZ35105.1 sigma-70 family RNA polymerase sigma factor [Sphingobacterium sp. PCS056]